MSKHISNRERIARKMFWLGVALVMVGCFAGLVLIGAPWEIWFPAGVISGAACGRAMVE